MLTILAWNNHSYKHTIPLLHPCMFTFSETIKSYTYDLRIRVMLMLPSLYWAFSKGIKSVYDVRAWCIHIGKTEWIKFLQFKDGIKKSDVQLLCIIMRSFLFWFEHLFICFSLFLFSHKIIFNFWRICEFDWIANRENYIEDLNQSFVTAHQINNNNNDDNKVRILQANHLVHEVQKHRTKQAILSFISAPSRQEEYWQKNREINKYKVSN